MSEDKLNSENKEELSHLGAVITILSVDKELYQEAAQFIDVFKATIDWDKIFDLPLSQSHRICCQWAYCIWKNAYPVDANPFPLIFQAEIAHRKAILRALKMHWQA